MLFRLLTVPPLMTRQTTSEPSIRSTNMASFPSSMRILVPMDTQEARPEKVKPIPSSLPFSPRARRVKLCPASRVTEPLSKSRIRISGPFVSKRRAMGRSSSALIRLTRSIRVFCSSWEPWEKLKRAQSMPPPIRARIASSESTAGPMVQMIFVLRIMFPPRHKMKWVYRTLII